MSEAILVTTSTCVSPAGLTGSGESERIGLNGIAGTVATVLVTVTTLVLPATWVDVGPEIPGMANDSVTVTVKVFGKVPWFGESDSPVVGTGFGSGVTVIVPVNVVWKPASGESV